MALRQYSAILLATAATAAADVPTTVIRHEFLNTTGASNSGAVIVLNGNIDNGTTGPVPTSGGVQLRESTLGQPVSAFGAPYPGFADQVLFTGGLNGHPPVYPQLYPAGFGQPAGVSGTPAQIASSSAAFRYKWLTYGEGQDENGQPAILNLYSQGNSVDAWFTADDRANAEAQIRVLREALAYSPLDRQLQSALLDVYYDLAVIELLQAQSLRVELAEIRLGLDSESIGNFIIDKEIDKYYRVDPSTGDESGMLVHTRNVLEQYAELLTLKMEGFEPGDLDPAAGGAPFGYWLFQRAVPGRNQTPTQYAQSGGGQVEDVAPPTPANTFSGYKDYRSLLTALGQDIQYRAELARLLGMRQAGASTSFPEGDITAARRLLSLVQGGRTSDYQLLQRMFATVDFDDPQLDATGVRGAFTLVENALNEAVGVRGFLNGTNNVLGLDPNFLILLPPDVQAGHYDTFDILVGDDPTGGDLDALAIAIDAMGDPDNPLTGGGAIQAYSTFRGSVDRVSTELVGLETDYAVRLEDITGYIPAGFPADWDGSPKPSTACELATVERTIQSLKTQNITLGQITLQLLADVANANEAVSIAENIDDTITGAQASYLNETSAAWTEIHVWAGLAAGSQAVTEGTIGAVSASLPGAGAVAANAGGVNAAVQTAAAVRTSMREQELDEAAIGFQTTLALAEAPLTVKQAELEAGSLMREAYSNRLEIAENFTALAQAFADKAALQREVQRLGELLNSSRSALAEKFYADPIHFVRAERATLQADAEFRRAQRWVFFTARALEHKWQERFSYADATIGETYDIGRIFSARNAAELKTLVTKMVQFDADRETSPGTQVPSTTYISLRDHILTPNPDDRNLDFNPFPADAGLRYDPATGQVVTKIERFRSILTELMQATGGGAIEINFDTTKLENLQGNFFAGPDYTNPTSPVEGLYRDKIDWIAVNIIAADAPEPGNLGIPRAGVLTYGGNTFFRTRVPPCWTRDPAGNVSGGPAFDPATDFPGEFIIAPVRLYEDTSFNGVFNLSPAVEMSSVKMAYSSSHALNSTQIRNDILADIPGVAVTGYRRTDLRERSVAATRWTLRINPGQIDISQIEDIELIIQHNSYTRPQITCPPLP